MVALVGAMAQRWCGLMVILLVGCGDASSDLTASTSPAPGSGGAPTTGSEGNDGGAPEYECTACAIYQSCEGSVLFEQLDEDTDCEATVIQCEHGCLELNNWAGCAIQCGGTVCPAPHDMFPRDRAQCCTADGRCGIAGRSTDEPDCTPVEPIAPVDPTCPVVQLHPGCCTPSGTCGVVDPVPGAGCVSALDLGAHAASSCDAGAATDAGD